MTNSVSPSLAPSVALFQDEGEDKENSDMVSVKNLSSKLTAAALCRPPRQESKSRVLTNRDNNAGVFRFNNRELNVAGS